MIEDMITVEVPEAQYAVFTTPPVDTSQDEEQKEFAEIIKATWKYIFEEWFKRIVDTVMEIYVPVKN